MSDEPQKFSPRFDRIQEAFSKIEKVFEDEITAKELNFIEVDAILLFLKQKIDTYKMDRYFDWRVSEVIDGKELSKDNPMYK